MHFEEKNDFFLYLPLIFVEAPSENLVAMATSEIVSFKFWFQNISYIFVGKVTKFQEIGVMLQKPQGGGGGGVKNTTSPNRLKQKRNGARKQ